MLIRTQALFLKWAWHRLRAFFSKPKITGLAYLEYICIRRRERECAKLTWEARSALMEEPSFTFIIFTAYFFCYNKTAIEYELASWLSDTRNIFRIWITLTWRALIDFKRSLGHIHVTSTLSHCCFSVPISPDKVLVI